MSTKPNSESKPNPGASDSGAPDLAEYLIGGAVLKLVDDPDALLEDMKGKLAEGLKPSPLFIVQWQRTAMHLAHYGKSHKELELRVDELEKKIAKLEKRRS